MEARRPEYGERIEVNLNDTVEATLDAAAQGTFIRRHCEMFPYETTEQAARMLEGHKTDSEQPDSYRFLLVDLFAYFGPSMRPISTFDRHFLPFGTRFVIYRQM